MNGDAAKNFANYWNGHGNEYSDYQDFWRDLLHDVFGVERTTGFIEFQKPVVGKHIDAYIPSTKVLIEHKSFGEDLDRKYRQSDGEYLTPLEQAKRYVDNLPASERPRKIITCNFNEFRIYDLPQMDSLQYLSGVAIYKPTVIKLENFRNDFTRLKFIVDPNAEIKPEVKISKDAAKIVRKICAAIDKNYANRDDAYIDALSKLCARLVFCFYADDEKLFTKIKFDDYLATLKNLSPEQLRDAIQKVFDVLNTPKNERDDFDDELKKFPCVDGGLFDEKIPIPPLSKAFQFETKYAHYVRTNTGFRMDEFNEFVKFSWREIEPPIFGAMFESLFNPETRRSDGIHYTIVDNIHKVIDRLFLDDLTVEFADIKHMHKKNRVAALRKFQDKIASLNFLDPACGSGNFLTETYLCLRSLENKVIEELCNLYADIPYNPVKVTPRQFYGIEINDFAVAIAKDALWIAEIQMLRKTAWIVKHDLEELPLRKYISIRKANALQIDWSKVVAPANVDYIIGNPPFVGARMKSAAQADDIKRVFDGWQNVGNLDYVTCWYKKAADFIAGTNIRCAFVSTNSVCQGDQVGALWKNLFAAGVHIDFAYRTFKWLSDSDNMAHVHCVIVGFSSAHNDKPKIIFDGDKVHVATNINAYLVDGENIFVESRNAPIQKGVPEIGIGNKPIDGGNYLFTPDEMEDFIKHEPDAEKYFKLWFGAEEFIRGKRRYCLWLGDLPLDEIKKMPLCWERVEAVKNYRLASKSAGTRKIAATPTRFHVENFPRENYLVMAKTSSGERHYIPMGFMNDSVLCSDKVFVLPNATLYHFGILTSSIHMAWMRMTNCPLGTSYSYSIAIVYNNFPWCAVTMRRRQMIEETAQKILDVRAKFDGWTFAALYDPQTMPDELRLAHKANDYAVALAYGFEDFWTDEAAVVAELMKLYKRLTT